MAIEPISNLSYLCKVYPLLRDLYKHEAELYETDIYSYISRNRQSLRNLAADDPLKAQPAHIFERLKKCRFRKEVDGHTTIYELSKFTKEVVRYYEQEHHFASSEEIEGFRRSFETLYDDLDEAYKSKHKNLILPIVENISHKAESLRHTANSNRLATIDAVKKTKLNIEQQSTESRFKRINYIHSKYVEPLGELVAINMPMDIALERVESILKEGLETFTLHKDITFKIDNAISTITVLRRTLKQSLSESSQEIIPLLNTLRTNLFVKGATYILDQVETKGLMLVDELTSAMDLPLTRKTYSIFDEEKLLDFLLKAKDYTPIPPPKIDFNKNLEPSIEPPLDMYAILLQVKADLPIANAFVWVKDKFPDKKLVTHLEIYDFLYRRAENPIHQDRVQYQYEQQSISLCPFSIKEIN